VFLVADTSFVIAATAQRRRCDSANVNANPKLKRSHRTYREQLFRFLWRVKPWSNAGTAASAGTIKLTEPMKR
jgi:hypothetical protein